jgi:hypothetical protein
MSASASASAGVSVSVSVAMQKTQRKYRAVRPVGTRVAAIAFNRE